MGKLKLTVNEEKTRICKVPEGEFDFLGYSFGRMYSARTGQAYWGTALEEEHQAHGRERPRADHPIVDLARDHRAGEPVEPNVARMGELLRSRHVSKAYRAIDNIHRCAVAPVVRIKHKTRRRKGGSYPLSHLYGHFGLVRLCRLGTTCRG